MKKEEAVKISEESIRTKIDQVIRNRASRGWMTCEFFNLTEDQIKSLENDGFKVTLLREVNKKKNRALYTSMTGTLYEISWKD